MFILSITLGVSCLKKHYKTKRFVVTKRFVRLLNILIIILCFRRRPCVFLQAPAVPEYRCPRVK